MIRTQQGSLFKSHGAWYVKVSRAWEEESGCPSVSQSDGIPQEAQGHAVKESVDGQAQANRLHIRSRGQHR